MSLLEKTIFSISELNNLVRFSLEEQFSKIWIEGEVSNLVTPASGHSYFSLKDSQAQLRCAFFSSYSKSLSFKLENGMHVIAYGKISLYEARGDYQFIVETMEEAGDGKLQRAFELLKQKLSKAGLFNPDRKRPLPTLPKQIGIITSPTGAAIQDILKLLKERFPLIPIIIYPSLVQGSAASENMIKMLKIANERQECDILILTRGGGSLEDLWAFNDEALAYAIFESHIPVVSAVGHEIDFTIADFVADVRAPTPSAAATFITPHQKDTLAQLSQISSRLIHNINHFLQQKKERLLSLRSRLPHPLHQLREHMQRVDNIERRFLFYIQHRFLLLKQQLASAIQALEVINPLATLKRGYAIAMTKNKKIITSANTVKIGSKIEIKLSEGELQCEVLKN